MNRQIDYYVFVNSPYTHLGHRRLGEIARARDAAIRVRPMDAAKVFPVSGGLPLAQRAPQRRAYRLVELARWRDHLRVPMNIEPKFFPTATEAAARLIVAAEEVSSVAAFDLLGRVLAAVWLEQKNIADNETLMSLADAAALDGRALLARAQSEQVAQRYEQNTQQAIALQVFGAPTYIYRGELFWGQDRLDFLDRALAS